MDSAILDRVRLIAPALARLPERFESTYDREADVLYISFEPGTEADDSELTDDDLLLRYKDERLIGITVMQASARPEMGALGQRDGAS